MKNIARIIAITLVFAACQQKAQENQETADSVPSDEVSDASATLNYYGEKINPDGAMKSEDLLAALEGKDSVAVKLSSQILSTCKVKGCWMKVNLAENSDMRVTFKDYGFFVPKEGMEGKETIIEGYATQIETDVATLKHYAQDAGKTQEEIDAITEPKREVAFVAKGVIIK